VQSCQETRCPEPPNRATLPSQAVFEKWLPSSGQLEPLRIDNLRLQEWNHTVSAIPENARAKTS
jgi:hypothetical protein